MHEAVVADPLGRPVSARWLMLPGRTAVVEAAEAIGFALLRPEELDAMRASSRGLGELIHAALDDRPDELLLCLGDTATVDGGAGLLEVFGGFLVPARAACDVQNLLLGLGAGPPMPSDRRALPGTGGGAEARLSAGRASGRSPTCRVQEARWGHALAALGAELVSGAELVFELVDSASAPRSAELVVTGEGTVDHATLEGRRRESRSGLRRGRSPLRCFRRTDQRAAIWCRAAELERRPGPGARISSLSESCSESRSRTGRALAELLRERLQKLPCDLRVALDERSELPRGEPVAPSSVSAVIVVLVPSSISASSPKYWPGPSFASSLPPAGHGGVSLVDDEKAHAAGSLRDNGRSGIEDPFLERRRQRLELALVEIGEEGRAGSVRLSQACARF